MKRLFKNRLFWISLGTLMLFVLVWLATGLLEWILTTRLLAVIILLILVILVLVIQFVRSNQSASAIEASIKQQAQFQLQHAPPDRRDDIEDLQRRLETAIDRLKKSKLGDGRRGRAALYALPWYLFIGPPGSGKTTAIANSGLNFPMGVDRVRGVGGTRDCDWFFSDSAILLDTAGRYTTERDDDEEWYAFLDTLKQHRSARPINGVIVGMSIADLIEATPAQIDEHAQNIRRRCDELIQRLEVQFPVYLVFTKCDLIQGFVSTFGELSRREREQIWGCTFDLQTRTTEIRTRFEQEFKRLADALVAQRAKQLSQSMKREDRSRVFVFPVEFEALRDNLSLFVESLFQSNPYQETPLLRGFYFTSGTQEGIPLDRVIQAMARQFELPPVLGNMAEVEPVTKSYFIKDFFTRVVIPDRNLARQTSSAARRVRWMQTGVAIASIAGLALLVLGLSGAVVQSRLNINEVRDAVAEAAAIEWTDRSATEVNFARLDHLHEQVEQLERRRFRPPLWQLGLYRAGSLLPAARDVHLSKIRTFMEEVPVALIERRLQQGLPPDSAGTGPRERLYEALKAYQLVSTETARLDESNVSFLTRYLTQVAEPYVLRGRQGEEGAEAQDQLSAQVTAFVEALQEEQIAGFEGQAALVRQSRRQIDERGLRGIPAVYARIKREGREQWPSFTLRDALQGSYLNLFEGEPEVEGVFTQQGWVQFVQPRLEQESRDPTEDDWVMGREGEQVSAVMQDEARMRAELERLYFTDYADAWQRFLDRVRLKPFVNMAAASRHLQDLSSVTDSPLMLLLAEVTRQTTFEDEEDLQNVLDTAEDVARGRERRLIDRARDLVDGAEPEETGPAAPRRELNPVERRFAALHTLNAVEVASGGAPALSQALESLNRVGLALDEVSFDGGAAVDLVAGVLEQRGGALEQDLRAVESALNQIDRDVRDHLFTYPIEQAWTVTVATAQERLNERWAQEVCTTYDNLLGDLYPLDATSSIDAPIQDFEAFFRPVDGEVATFYQETLSPFLSANKQDARTWRGQGIRFSPATLAALRKADAIGEGLFAGGVLRTEFDLRAEFPERPPQAPAVSQIQIDIHGQTDRYDMGQASWQTYQWPSTPGARLSVRTQSGTLVPKSFEGDWAWFRLLQEATVRTGASAASYRVEWEFERGIIIRYSLRTRSRNNPFGDSRFFEFRCPPTLN